MQHYEPNGEAPIWSRLDDCHVGITDSISVAFLGIASALIILVTLTLFMQCAGMGALVHWARSRFARGLHRLGLWRSSTLIVRFTSLIVVLHGLQILLWAWFYRWKCFPAWESALYFSTTSYSTVGAGDLLLPRTWRLLGAAESITGVLMCGLSVSFIFVLIMRLVEREARFFPELAWTIGPEASTAGVRENRVFGPVERHTE